MASRNPFDLLGDFDNDDPSLVIAAQVQIPSQKPAAPAKLPTKPLPPAQAVREARSNAAPARGGVGGGRVRGRGARGAGPGWNRNYGNENTNGFVGEYGGAAEDGDNGKPVERERGSYGGPRQPYRGGRRGGYVNGEAGGESERPRRVYERRSGTGRGSEVKRDGSGRGNWGTTVDDIIAQGSVEAPTAEDSIGISEKEPEKDVPVSEANKDANEEAVKEKDEKEEEKEMTLEEYEKIKEEKRKALVAMKAEERKVELDKDFESMKLLSVKDNNDVFIKLGSDKDTRKLKDSADKDERVKKHVSINDFLKPAEGGRYYRPGGRGRGRGRGDRGNGTFGYDAAIIPEAAIKIEDTKQFPSLGGK